MQIKNGLGPDHIVSSTMIDADNDDLTGLPTTGQPLVFFGSGRPDQAGLNLQAPIGSTYTCTAPDVEPNCGAAIWRYTGTQWIVEQGDTGWREGAGIALESGLTTQICKIRRTQDTVSLTLHYIPRSQLDDYVANKIATLADGWHSLSEPQYAGATVGAWTALGYSPNLKFQSTGHAWLSGNQLTWAFDSNTMPPQADVYGVGIQAVVPVTAVQWPTTWGSAARSIQELRELIETEADPEKLQQLKDELTALTGTKPGALD